MVKNGEETAKKEGKTTGNVLPVLLGTGTGLVLLLLLTLLAAGLIWSGVLPVSIAGMSLTIAAGLCALVGSGKKSAWFLRRQHFFREPSART